MAFAVKSYPDESPYKEAWTVVTTSPLVIIKAKTDPKRTTDNACWQIYKETYDVNGILSTKLWMNGSNRFDQVYDNRLTATYL
jgi:hypothetical protein